MNIIMILSLNFICSIFVFLLLFFYFFAFSFLFLFVATTFFLVWLLLLPLGNSLLLVLVKLFFKQQNWDLNLLPHFNHLHLHHHHYLYHLIKIHFHPHLTEETRENNYNKTVAYNNEIAILLCGRLVFFFLSCPISFFLSFILHLMDESLII